MTTIPMSPKALAALMVSQMADGDSVEQAVREGRCLRPNIGCGQAIKLDRQTKQYAFPDPAYRAEWKLTGLCPSCQDRAALTEDGETIVRGED